MKVFFTLVFICSGLSLALTGTAQESKQADSTNQEKLEPGHLVGDWNFDSGNKAGEASGEDRLGSVTIDKEKFTMPVGGGQAFVMAYTIDNGHSPVHIDLKITAGPAPEAEAKGIIAIEDGKIKLCYHPAGGERPDGFESDGENGNFLFVMSRSQVTSDDLAGDWNYASGKRAGEEVAAERLVGQVTISDKTFTLPASATENFVMEYKLDGTEFPTAIDLDIKEGPVTEGRAVGIIKKEDGKIVFCYDPSGQKRPESFESTSENGFFLFVLKPVEDE